MMVIEMQKVIGMHWQMKRDLHLPMHCYWDFVTLTD
jgi:hypothetical protein